MLEQIFLHQKKYSLKLRQEPLSHRQEALSALERMISENTADIVQALKDDFAKPEAETLTTEIYPLLKEIADAKKNLAYWHRPTPVESGPSLLGTRSFIQREPLGVCLIISPWNYPLNLALSPLISAIAAGNCAILKPSELSRFTSAFLKKNLPRYFQEEHVAVVEGGKETTEELLKFPFDHIFFTGSTRVGKSIMEAASKHLSKVTLELGGKSPTIVDESANLRLTAEKIVWGKFLNAGQTCVAPDYLFVQESVWSDLKRLIIENIERSYGRLDKQVESSNFARMISSQHAQRLASHLEETLAAGAELTYGGKTDPAKRFIGPTIVEKTPAGSPLMKEEIFGPILPVLTYKEISEVIAYLQEQPKPLAMYIFSSSRHNTKLLLQSTSSGGVCINDCILHVGNHHLPFGGVGESGIGNYHGYFGFRAFSHERAVMKRTWGHALMRNIYPPYTTSKLNMIRNLIRWKI